MAKRAPGRQQNPNDVIQYPAPRQVIAVPGEASLDGYNLARINFDFMKSFLGGDIDRQDRQIITQALVREADAVRELAHWYREFGKRTGSPLIREVRLGTARNLEELAGEIEQSLRDAAKRRGGRHHARSRRRDDAGIVTLHPKA